MKEVTLTHSILDDSAPYEMMLSISSIMYAVHACNDSVRIEFGSNRISPIFAIPIMAMCDSLRKKGFSLMFNPAALKKNSAMQRFFLDSDILNNMNPLSGKTATEAIKKAEAFYPTEASRVLSHRIDLQSLLKLSDTQQHQQLVREAHNVLRTISSIVNKNDLTELTCKLIELFANAIYHSQSNDTVYSSAVELLNGECLVAVYDQGIGIPGAYNHYRNSYKNKLALRELNDPSAIHWAMQKGTSTLQCQDGFSRGVGLSSMKDFIDQYNGMICIASGKGYYSYKNGNEDTRCITIPLKGTLFMMKLTAA